MMTNKYFLIRIKSHSRHLLTLYHLNITLLGCIVIMILFSIGLTQKLVLFDIFYLGFHAHSNYH